MTPRPPRVDTGPSMSFPDLPRSSQVSKAPPSTPGSLNNLGCEATTAFAAARTRTDLSGTAVGILIPGQGVSDVFIEIGEP